MTCTVHFKLSGLLVLQKHSIRPIIVKKFFQTNIMKNNIFLSTVYDKKYKVSLQQNFSLNYTEGISYYDIPTPLL